MTDREWIAEDDHLNREALRALMNARVDREKALADLFQSDIPIHWAVRDALALAFSQDPPEFGSNLAFVGNNPTRKKAKAYEKRKLWLSIAATVRTAQNENEIHDTKGAYEKALTLASKLHKCSRETARDSLTYANRADAWAKSVHVSGTIYGLYTYDDLISRFIGFDASGEEIPPNATLAKVGDEDPQRLAYLLEIFSEDNSNS